MLANSLEGNRLRNIQLFEKAYLIRACQLTDAQKRELEKLDDSWKEELRKQGEGNPKVGIARVLMGGFGAPNPRNDVVNRDRKFRTSLRAQFAGLLTDEQRKTYEEELAARDEFKSRVDAECLVDILDKSLDLSPDQREALTRRLIKWQGKDDLYIQYFFSSDGTLPMIPDNLLSPHFSPKQMTIYRNARKINIRLSQFQAQHIDAFGE